MTDLVRAAFEVYTPRIGRRPYPMEVDYGAAIGRDEIWVAVRGQSLFGVLVLRREPSHLQVETIAVPPASQGFGVGSALLSLADHRARAYGLGEVRLFTNEAMVENLSYYPRRGYVETGRAESGGFRRVFFTKAVPSGSG